MMMRSPWRLVAACGLALALSPSVPATEMLAAEILDPVPQRFAAATVQEVPNFQKHVVPTMSRLGCNGRACHGSFQGQGGFRLSLFGYDFQADHDALLDKESPRIDVQQVAESLILTKPTDADLHEGGKRFDKQGWEYNVFRRWIEAGAPFDAKQVAKLEALEVTPSELVFAGKDERVPLRVVAVWEDGSREDVTPLCRFHSNNGQIAQIDADGVVTSGVAGDTHLVVAYDKEVLTIPVLRPFTELVGDRYPQVPTPTPIDQHVVTKLRKLGIVPSELSTDAEFLRRVSLDLTGTLPAASEVEAFLADNAPDKRRKKIDELLESPAYAAWWTTVLCDFTGNNDAQLNNVLPVRNRASQDWYDWIYKRVADNVPYDQLVAGIVVAKSRREGQSYTDYSAEMCELYRKDSDKSFAEYHSLPYFWARRNFQKPEERAIGFAYTFLGIRIQCAQCHKHPFDIWSKQDFADFQNFFGGIVAGNNRVSPQSRKEYDEIVAKLKVDDELRGNQLRQAFGKLLEEGQVVPFPELYVNLPRPTNARNARNARNRGPQGAREARLLGGEMLDLTEFDDPRDPLMAWLRDENNPYFAKAFANRVWARYFNRGIVDPPDDLSKANAPSNKPLLDYLAQGFIANGMDMKWLHREIANSRTYQLSWRPNDTNRMDETNFSRAVPRRLPAEVAYDALRQATSSTAIAESTRSKLDGRAIALAGASTRSQNRGASYALTVFGRSTRESNCDCDRSVDSSLLQTVFLQNDQETLSMLDQRGTSWLSELTRGKLAGASNATAGQANPRLLAAGRKQVQQLASRLKQAREAGNERQVEQLVESLKRARQRLARLAPAAPSSASNSAGIELTLGDEELVEQAYLRTLSRYPDSEEKARCLQYLADASNKVDGARGILWALINTKEFIVNH